MAQLKQYSVMAVGRFNLCMEKSPGSGLAAFWGFFLRAAV